MKKIKKYGIIGNDLSNSLSPVIHNFFYKEFNLNIQYTLLSSNKYTLERDIKNFFLSGGKGLSVTYPFKELSYHIANIKKKNTLFSKSSNTLLFEKKKIICENFDGIGLINDIKKNFFDIKSKNILILGYGGATKCILEFLLRENPKCIYILTKKNITKYYNKNIIFIKYNEKLEKSFSLIINTIPEKFSFESDIKYNLNNDNIFYDLSYKKNRKNIIFWKRNFKNIKILKCGIGMLIEQAALQFFFWEKKMPKIDYIKKFFGEKKKLL